MRETLRFFLFSAFPCIGFESLIWKTLPTGFGMTRIKAGCRCLVEGCLELPGASQDFSWIATFPRRWARRGQEPEVLGLAFSQKSATNLSSSILPRPEQDEDMDALWSPAIRMLEMGGWVLSGAQVLDIQSRCRYSYSLSPYVFQVSQGIELYPPQISGQNQSKRGS